MTSKFALVIANTEYQDASFAKLTAPGKDAEEFAQVLRELATFDDVQILLNEGEGRTRRSIARFFAERKRDDLLLLYFSGHGVRNEQGQLFLAANDTEINILEASGIPAEFVTNSMNNSRSQRQLLILDCCNSGAFAHGSKSASGVGKSMGIATAFEGSGFGRVVLTATDATQYAWEGDKVIGDTQKSVFTHFLIEGLKGEADRDGDGRIHVDELYDYAYEQIVRRTPKQTPGKWSYKQQGDLILRENLKPRDVKPAPLPLELLEMLAHPNSGVRRAGVQELIGLLDGKHQGLARAAQDKLHEIAENDDSLSLRRAAIDTLTVHGIIFEQSVSVADEDKKVVNKEIGVTTPAKVNDVQPRVLPDLKHITSSLNLRLVGGIAAGILVIALSIWGISNLNSTPPSSTFEPTQNLISTSAITFTPPPAKTSTPSSSTQTSPLPAPTLSIGSTMTGKDGMTLLYVPAGEFIMGSEDDNGQPVHSVYLDAFWIDQSEITNAMYAQCVQNSNCNEPKYDHMFNNSNYANYPVVYVSWNDAQAYCSWADRRLPTEAEWEKSASWNATSQTKYVYPWGNEAPNSNLLNYKHTIIYAAEVARYPDGVSPYGAFDMAGNVWEWVSDWYDENYYATLKGNARNPPGPVSGLYRILRGGAWNVEGDYFVRSTYRYLSGPMNTVDSVGFRCALSADEQAESSISQPIATEASTPSSAFSIGSTLTGQDDMTLLYVPAGEFTMGSNQGGSNERPTHRVFLDDFWIDETEVTNGMYAKCVLDGACSSPNSTKSSSRETYFGDPQYDNYPVINVTWDAAKMYCAWVNRRLPTEAEWEKAARGTDEREFPWGNNSPTSDWMGFQLKDTTEVGKYLNGASPYGALDMAGNVWEWVADWYRENYYTTSLISNPLGPDSGSNRGLRGGSWYVYRTYQVIGGETYVGSYGIVTSWDRLGSPPDVANNYFGFRCAMSAKP